MRNLLVANSGTNILYYYVLKGDYYLKPTTNLHIIVHYEISKR